MDIYQLKNVRVIENIFATVMFIKNGKHIHAYANIDSFFICFQNILEMNGITNKQCF